MGPVYVCVLFCVLCCVWYVPLFPLLTPNRVCVCVCLCLCVYMSVCVRVLLRVSCRSPSALSFCVLSARCFQHQSEWSIFPMVFCSLRCHCVQMTMFSFY